MQNLRQSHGARLSFSGVSHGMLCLAGGVQQYIIYSCALMPVHGQDVPLVKPWSRSTPYPQAENAVDSDCDHVKLVPEADSVGTSPEVQSVFQRSLDCRL